MCSISKVIFLPKCCILGNILGFDNTRLVHGRVGYQDTDENKRFLIGIFLDWDEIYSQLRVLKGELNIMNIPH